MRRKYYFISLATVALLLTSSVVAYGQSSPLSGHVVMTGADGQKTPVAGAIVDVFRVDVPGKYETKTDKKGRFTFAGVPFNGRYIISVSAPNAQPAVLSNVQPGPDVDYEVVMTAGDGRRLTLEEARSVGGRPTAAPGTESAAERAAREELARKNAEIEAENKKIANVNEVLNRTFKAGQAALTAKQWDVAIAQFKEGVAADPEQPALWSSLSEALRFRGTDRYNTAAKATDEAARKSGREAAFQDWREAADAASKAVDIVKKKPAATDPAEQTRQNQNKLAAFGVRFKAMLLVVGKIPDMTQADAGMLALQDYLSVETDAAKKAQAQVDAAQMLLDAGASDKAFAEFRKILDANPDNIEAMLGAGLALFQSGDKTKFQEAANYLQQFVEKAPDTHKLKASAKEALDYLKSNENIRPERSPAAGRRRRG